MQPTPELQTRTRFPRQEGRAETLLDDFLNLTHARPDRVALVSYLSGRPEPVRLTYGRMAEIVDRLALRLLDWGVRPGDVVSFQLPNRWEFTVAHLATIRVGAISNPIMPIYGKREVRFMLERTRSRVCLGVAIYRKARPGKLLEEIRDELDALDHLLLIDDGQEDMSLERQLGAREIDEASRRKLDALKPGSDDLEMILFSSGTTGEPKGVLHSFNSAWRATSNSFSTMGMSEADVVLMFSPLAHATGFLYGVNMPLYCGCRAVLQETWDPAEMLRIVEGERVTWTMGSAAFARDACDAAERAKHDLSSLRCFVSGGAPIPPNLVGRTARTLGAELVPCWGMTEAGITTIGRLTDSEDKRASSDGAPVPGVEVRVVNDRGEVQPPNTPGHLQLKVRGQHVAYYGNAALYEASFQDGWFRTGDLGRIDDDGYVRILGRSKDIVIRGGENIPVIEIENLLLDLPEVADIVIVGVPDERLGERCHAVVKPSPGRKDLRLGDLTAHLERLEVTKQYWPEFLTLVEEFPRTSTGKIQRFAVREALVSGRLAGLAR
jgi:cyclohexanecarboxylate-CoA ligase